MKTRGSINSSCFLFGDANGAKNIGTDKQMGRVDGYNPQSTRRDTPFTLTNVYDKDPSLSFASGDMQFFLFSL